MPLALTFVLDAIVFHCADLHGLCITLGHPGFNFRAERLQPYRRSSSTELPMIPRDLPVCLGMSRKCTEGLLSFSVPLTKPSFVTFFSDVRFSWRSTTSCPAGQCAAACPDPRRSTHRKMVRQDFEAFPVPSCRSASATELAPWVDGFLVNLCRWTVACCSASNLASCSETLFVL